MVARAFISPDELYSGRVVTYAEVAALAATLNRAESLKFLGYLSLLLSCATTEAKLKNDIVPLRDVQTWLFREVVSESLLNDLKAKFRNADLLDRPILHRSQLLFAIRLAATHGDANGGNMLNVRADFDVIGDLLFLISGLFAEENIPRGESAAALVIATHAGPLYELENPPPIELTWPRVQELLIERLSQAAGDPAELERLQQVAVFTTGFGVQAWLDLSYMLFSYWAAKNFRELMEDTGRGYLNPNQPYSVISREILQRAVEGIGVPFDEVPTQLRIELFSRSTLFDLTPFRTKPLWLMPDGLVMCVDTGLLTERLGPHAFWSVMNALDTPDRRRRFSGAWGSAFETYCLDALGEVFRGKKWFFARNPRDASINEELWDAVAARDTTVIAVEIKGTFIVSGDKYSGVPRYFARGLAQKFGMMRHGGAFQLARGISRVWFERAAQTPIPHPDKITDVFPVLVVQDPIFSLGAVSRVVSDWFENAMARRRRSVGHKIPRTWPLTIMTADELDRVAASVQATGVRLDSMLKRFHRTFPSRARSLSELLDSNDATEYGFPAKVRQIVADRFAVRTRGVIERFRAAEYGRSVDVLAQ